ncbi:hypothetical protein Tco_0758531 [Tanacetum coccineum]
MSMSVQKSQVHKTATRSQDDDKRLCLVDDLKEVQLLQNSSGDSGPDLSFDKLASPERLFSLARVSLAEASNVSAFADVPLSFLLKFSIMAKKDMDMYHSRLTQDDLNDLIIKYKIPRDLHPRLPSEEFVMAELPDDAIGDWFSFAKRRAHSPICIDDNRSCMKNWKSGFFLINQRAIPNAMVWRHPDAAIDDPRPAAGSFNMADVCLLSAHVVKPRDMPKEEPYLDVRPTLQRLPFYCTPLATADAVIPEPALKDLAISTPSSKIVAKAEASQKRKASTFGAASSHVAKRTSDDDDDAYVDISLVTHLRSAVVIPSLENQGGSFIAPAAKGSNTRDSRSKGVMVDDAAAPSAGVSRPRLSSRPAPSFRDVSGDAIHIDFFPFSACPYYATYPEDGVAGNCEFTREEWDAPYRPTFGVLTKEVFKDPAIFKTIVDQFPTLGEMVHVESLSDDQLTTEMSVLHCMMMSHDGELLARYRGLNQSHHEYVLSTDSRLKGYEEKSKAKGKKRKKKIKSLTKSLDNLHSGVARLFAAFDQATILEAERDEEILRLKATPSEFSSFFRVQFQGLVRKFLASDEFSRIQGELLSLATSLGFERGLSMHRIKDEFAAVLKKMVNFMPGAQVILHLEAEKLARPTNVPTPRDTRSSPPIAKESTMTHVSKSLELSINVVPASSIVTSEQNEEQVYAAIDGSDLKMAGSDVPSKSEGVFVQGVSRIMDDVVEVAAVESERVSSGPTDVVVALSTDGKGDVLIPSSVAGEEAVINSSVV